MPVRKIIQIDEGKCNGCGLCVSSCEENAIQILDGKARLVKDQYCDGLGACLGECPQGALTIVEREAVAFNADAVQQNTGTGHSNEPKQPIPVQHPMRACSGASMHQLKAPTASTDPTTGTPSALRQWPVQLHLVSPQAPYFKNADLLLAADCAAFACGYFHALFMKGHAISIACPKLDDTSGYVEKLAAMITDAGIHSITIVMMQVPCCRGLERLVNVAMQSAGRSVMVERVILSLEGEVL